MLERNTGGLIKYFDLTDWWLQTFKEDGRKKINDTFQPLGMPPDSLTIGSPDYVSGSAAGLLSSLAGWFKKEDRQLAYKIMEKAESLISGADILDRHFLYQKKIQTYYPYRDLDNIALLRAIEGCEQQIAMSKEAAEAFKKRYHDNTLPAHVGYQQLSIIREKQETLREAIQISENAKREGWAGDWEARIARYEKRLAKQVGSA